MEGDTLMKCKSCIHWKARCETAVYTAPGVRYGSCRRYPPARVAGYSDYFPEIDEDNWCGEYIKIGSVDEA